MDTSEESKKLTSSQLRKIKKPLIEKRRRERINESLAQLKSLILEALNKDENQYNKMEKADILELTVKHLKNLMKQQQGQVSSSRYPTITPAVSENHQHENKYKDGFVQCASEVQNYMQKVGSVRPDIQNQLSNHLNNCVQNISGQKTVGSVGPPAQLNGYVHILPKDSLVVGGECLASPVLQGIQCVQQVPVLNGQTIVLAANAIPGFNSQSLQPMLQLTQPVLTNNDTTQTTILANGNAHQTPIFTSVNTQTQVPPSVNSKTSVFTNDTTKQTTNTLNNRHANSSIKTESSDKKLSTMHNQYIDNIHPNQGTEIVSNSVHRAHMDNVNKISLISSKEQHQRATVVNSTVSNASYISTDRITTVQGMNCQQNLSMNTSTSSKSSDGYFSNRIPHSLTVNAQKYNSLDTQQISPNAVNRNYLYQHIVPTPDTVWRPW